MNTSPTAKVRKLRALGLLPLVALGLLSTLATGGGGGGGDSGGAGAPGTLQFVDTSFDAPEGTVVNIRVSRSGGSSGVVSVDYESADGTAVAGSDYTLSRGALTWTDGQSGNRTISIPITDDDTAELTESFTVSLSNVSGATLGIASSAVVSIIDDDVPRSARLSELSLSAGALDQIFQPSLEGYTASVRFLTPTIMVTATAEDPGATIAVEGADVASGATSDPITLNPGLTSITVEVSSADGVSSNTYTVDVTRQMIASFAQRAYIKASNTDREDEFGRSVALSGDTLAVGAHWEDSAATDVNGDQSDNSLEDSGAVYVFTRDGAGVWSQQAYIKAGSPKEFDSFGNVVALDGDTLAVGAIESDLPVDDNAGSVYVFTRNGAGVWSEQARLKVSSTDAGNDRFAVEFALSGNTLAVGAYWEDSGASGINGDQSDNSAMNSGAVYVFERDATGAWSEQAYIKASNANEDDWFGFSVALEKDTLVVGSLLEDSAATGVDGDQSDDTALSAGAVYVFSRADSGAWVQEAYIKASNTDPGDGFGRWVAVSGDTLAVGANGESSAATGVNGDQSDNSAVAVGAVYVFTRDEFGVWSQQAYIKASNTNADDDLFGHVALSGDVLAVAAWGEDSAATGIDGDQSDNSAASAGAVYVFSRDAEGSWSQQAYVKPSNTKGGEVSSDLFSRGLVLSEDTLAVSARSEDSAATGINGDQSDNSAFDSGAVYVFQ